MPSHSKTLFQKFCSLLLALACYGSICVASMYAIVFVSFEFSARSCYAGDRSKPYISIERQHLYDQARFVLAPVAIWAVCCVAFWLFHAIGERTRWFSFNPRATSGFERRNPNTCVEYTYAALSLLVISLAAWWLAFFVAMKTTTCLASELHRNGDECGGENDRLRDQIVWLCGSAMETLIVVGLLCVALRNTGCFGIFPVLYDTPADLEGRVWKNKYMRIPLRGDLDELTRERSGTLLLAVV